MSDNSAARDDVFDVNVFLKFLFCVLFLFVCCLTLMLYVNKVAAFFVTQIMRYFVLPKHTNFHVRGFHIAPLRARIFFQQVFLANENYSIRIVDGYFTFALWNSWLRDSRWSKVHDYMFSPDLIGMRCRVMVGFKAVKGTIREVDLERQKITVALDDGPSWSDEEEGDDDEEGDEEELATREATSAQADADTPSRDDDPDHLDGETREAVVGLEDGVADHLNRPFETGGAYYSSVGRKNAEARAAMRASTASAPAASSTGATASASTTRTPGRPSTQAGSTAVRFTALRGTTTTAHGAGADKVLKVYDMSDVSIRNRPGRCQLHLNGMRVCLYNATGKYEDLKNGGAAAKAADEGKAKDDDVSPHVKRLQRFFHRKSKNSEDLDAEPTDAARLRAQDDALKLQQHQLKHKSFMQKVFDIIRCIEIETSVSSIDVGGVGSTHPYFLHTAFRTGEGRVYLTQSGVPGIDLYRLVTEFTMQQVDMRMVPMDNKLTETQLMRNPTLLERTQLLLRGTADRHRNRKSSFLDSTVFNESSEIPDLIRDFGIILDGKDRSDVHIVFFRDAPNVHAGEEVVRGKVPTCSVEVLIDAQRLRYGPWLEYCRMQLWTFFLPPNFRPLQVMEFELGKPRPVCGFDMFVEFMTNTTIEVPFKRRAPAPSPPFGIKDSKRKGMLSATIGKGSQYIQPAFFLLKGEKKQRLEALFLGKNVNAHANAVLDRDNVQLCTAEAVQFFLDREDDIIWNGRKRWNIVAQLFNVEMYFYMSYVDFFLDLLNDWQFSQNMYHNVPLTTETFNTLERAVRDFIPNVKRFEVFVDKLTFHVNVNTHNVIYSENPNDRDQNIIATLCARSGSFSMILPSDQYQLAAENEVVRPLEAHASDIEVFLSLPKLHPLSAISSSEIRWAYARSMDIRGSFTSLIPCQSRAIPTDNLNVVTGRTRFRNYLNLEVDFTHVEGRLMGHHIKGLINALENLFLDNTLPIAPDELFWLLAKLQSHVALGKNKRKEFKQFLETKQPAGNDLEVAVSVTLRDVDAVACIGQGRRDPGLNVATSMLNFSYVKQFAVTDTCVTVSPITARFIDERGHIVHSPTAFICTGDIAVGLVKHFGPMPFKPKVHESMDVKVNGVSFSASVDQLMRVVCMAQTLVEHIKAEDPVMEAEVNEARSVAEYAADQMAPQSPATKYGMRRRQHTTESGSQNSTTFEGTTGVMVETGLAGVQTAEPADGEPGLAKAGAAPRPILEAYEEKDFVSRRTQGTFFEQRSADTASQLRAPASAPFSLGFADEVPYAVAEEYAAFMTKINDADEASKDYGIFCTMVSLGALEGAVKVGDAGFLTVYLPWGVTVATTTLNDGNSSNRLSIAARELSLRALVPRELDVMGVQCEQSEDPALPSVHPSPDLGTSVLRQYDKFLEVFLVQTSLCLRHYTAYPFDGSLEKHRLKQQRFVQDNDYEQLIQFAFDGPEGANPATTRPAAASPTQGTAGSGAQGTSPPSPPPPQGPRRTTAVPPSTAVNFGSPARPPTTAAADPPTLARRGKDEADAATASTFPPTASPADPQVDAFTQALANFSVAGVPLFEGQLGDTVEEGGGGTVPTGHRLPRRGTASPGDTTAVGERPDADEDQNGVDTDHDLHSLRSGRVGPSAGRGYSRGNRAMSDSAASGDTTVHVPGAAADLSSLSSDSTADFFGAGGGVSGVYGRSETTDVDCGGDVAGVFATCRSGSSESNSSDSSGIFDERMRFDDYATPHGDGDSLNASDSTRVENGTPGAAEDKSSDGAQANIKAALLTAVGFEQRFEHHFFCAYFRSTPINYDAETHSLLDFTTMRASRTTPHREWVHANAPLPSTSFVLYSVPTGFPDYVLAEQFMQTHYTRESDLYDWATRQANNLERSAHQSTTKHLHVELMEPMQVLLSRQFVCLVESAIDTVDGIQQQLTSTLARDSTAYSQDRAGTDFLGVQEQVRRRNAAAFFRPARNKAKSHARTQQKRWLTEDNIVTTMIPCIEVKFLSVLPVPVENTPPVTGSRGRGLSASAASSGGSSAAAASSFPFGVYSSTFAIRDVQLIMAQDRPPAGVAEFPANATQKVSASLSIASLALITQIEHEPLAREGNLSVEIPHLPYDDLKDTISVLYITDVQARIKEDTVRGSNGGACSIAINTIALHATRELVDYLSHSEKVLLAHMERIASKINRAATSFASPTTATAARGSPHSPNSRRAPPAFPESRPPLIVDRTRTLQGKGSLGSLYLSMTDTRRQGDCIVVDGAHPSCVNFTKVSTNFLLVVPNRRPGQPECVNLTTTGEVGALRATIYPCLVHCLQPRGDTLDWVALYADGAHTAEAMGTRVSFEEASAASHSPKSATLGPGARTGTRGSPVSFDPPLPRGPSSLPVKRQWVYNVAFTMRTLDAVVAHSTTNFAQIRGTNLTGGAESRLEPMRSRECVQMEALTESISPRLKERLRFLAHKARQRAARSRYSAPPSTTAQLQLYTTAAFFTQKLVARYVVDPVLHTVPGAAPLGSGGPNSQSGSRKGSAAGPASFPTGTNGAEVIVATIDGISADCQLSDQYDLLGQQIGIHAVIDKVIVAVPFHTHAEQTVNPQIVQYITSWRSAAKKMQASVGAGGGAGHRHRSDDVAAMHSQTTSPTSRAGGSRQPSKPVRNSAIVLHLQVRQMECLMGLPQGIQQRFLLPELCVFLRTSSNERLSLKLHAHPFSIVGKTDSPDGYCITLPNIYLIYAHDPIKMTCSLMMEPVSITITPQFVNHAILAYEKLTVLVSALVSKTVPLDEYGNVAHHAPSPMMPRDGRGSVLGTSQGVPRVAIKRGRRCSFLFLWQGFRFSYLTSVSNLRFSLRKLNAIGESSQIETRKTLEWTINVTGAQVALVDRDYHDKRDRDSAFLAARESQAVSTTFSHGPASQSGASSSRTQAHHTGGSRRANGRRADAPSQVSTAASSVPGAGAAPLAPLPLPQTPVAATTAGGGSTTATGTNGDAVHVDPLAGYTWGSVELNFTLSGGKTDRDTVKSTLMSTSFGAYTEEMQTALMSKLGATSAWWDLVVSSPLVLVRMGLVPLLNRCFEETKRDISFMKQAAMEENRDFQTRLGRHHTFHKLQKEKRRYEALINRNRQEQLEQLKRMTGQVALDLQRRRAGVSQGPGWDGTLPDLDVSTTHRFVATVTNFMVILPFGDTAFRSVLDELPEAFSCHRTEKHLHTVNCLDRRHFLPTLAFKTKVESTSFICEMTSSKSLQLLASPAPDPASSVRPVSPLADAPVGAVVAAHKFVGRFLATDTMLYFSPGVPVDTANGLASLRAIGRQPFLLGGDGNLAGSDVGEYHRARNTVHITTIDAPVHIKSTREKTSVAVVLDMSGPRVRLSPHFVTLMMELSHEFPTRKLLMHTAADAAAEAPAAEEDTTTTTVPAPTTSDKNVSVSDSDSSAVHHMTVDVSARLEAGDISLFSYGVEDEVDDPMGTATAAEALRTATGKNSSGDSVFRRGRFPMRVSRPAPGQDSYTASPSSHSSEFLVAARGASMPPIGSRAKSASTTTTGAGRSMPNAERRKRSWPGATSTGEDAMKCVLQIPLPTVLVQVFVRRSNLPEEDDIAAVRGDIHAGVIELGPSIGVVAREIEQTAAMHRQNVQERRKVLVALIQTLDKIATQSQILLLMPMHEFLLPVPRAYAAMVLTDRTQRMSVLHRRRKPPTARRPTSQSTTAGAEVELGDTVHMGELSPRGRYPRRHFITDVQVTLSDFRLVFSVEPFSSTAFTVFLDERGSVDVLCRVVKEYRHPLDPLPFVKQEPALSLIVNVRRLRAECQTKLEVKSLEIVLPEAQLVVSMREGTVGSVQSVAVNFPFNAEGSLPNVTLRMQHMAQVFMVTKIWTHIVTETKSSVAALAQKGAAMQSGAAALARRLGEATSTPVDLGTDKRVMVIVYLSHGIASVDMGSGNAHQLLFGAIRCAVERCMRTNGAMTYLLQTHVESLQMRSEGVLSGFATLRSVILQSFLILNAAEADEFLRSPDERTFRGTIIVQRVHVSFKERQLKDIFECRIGDLTGNVMDGIGVDNYTTSTIDISLANGTLGVTPSTVPAVLTFLRSISSVVADQKANASERIDAAIAAAVKAAQTSAKPSRRRASSVPATTEPVFSWAARARRDSADTDFSIVSSPWPTQEAHEVVGPSSPSSPDTLCATPRHCIAFLGNAIARIPCGQLAVTLQDTQLLLGAISSGQAASGCVVGSFARALFSFAETPCEDYTAAKKVLIVETHNAELYRPGATKVVILGFHGDNHFEFYTRQVLGQGTVGFTLTLRQTHPWTGNPRFRDFEEMITLVKSFTDRRNVTAFKQLGHSDLRFPLDGTNGDDDADVFHYGSTPPPASSTSASKRAAKVSIVSEQAVASDVRTLKPLRTSKFSPQLRFGGDVSVNTEVILNWLGITEKMLPAVLNCQLCDKLEMALYNLGASASERVRLAHDPNQVAPSSQDGDSQMSSPRPSAPLR